MIEILKRFKKTFISLGLLALTGLVLSMYLLISASQGKETFTFHSEILGETRNVTVYLPVGYSEQKSQRYDVLYTLDGERYRNNIMVAATAKALATSGAIPDIIVVAIDGQGTRMRDYGLDGATACNNRDTAGHASRFFSFLHKELLPSIDARFHTSDTKMIAGHSMGGLFTAYSFMSYSSVFDGYFAFSPTFPAAVGSVEAFEETLYDTETMDKFIYTRVTQLAGNFHGKSP